MTGTRTSMRLFILGATGGIGRQLLAQAIERHHQVTAFVRSPQKLSTARDGLTVIQGDVHNAEGDEPSPCRTRRGAFGTRAAGTGTKHHHQR